MRERKEIPEVMEFIKSTTVKVKLCPRCLQRYFTPYSEEYVTGVSPAFPALSRRDNKTLICSDCGVLEALEDVPHIKDWDEHKYWEEVK